MIKKTSRFDKYVIRKLNKKKFKELKEKKEYTIPRCYINFLSQFYFKDNLKINIMKYSYSKEEPSEKAHSIVFVEISKEKIAELEIKGIPGKKNINQAISLKLLSLLFPKYYKLYNPELKEDIEMEFESSDFDSSEENENQEDSISKLVEYKTVTLLKNVISVYYD